MADPVKKPLTWSRAYPSYAERHDMHRVFQEALKELIIMKPPDPLAYLRDELPKIANQLYAPRVFLVGPNVTTQGIGRHMAQATGARYLTLSDVVETAPQSIRGVLAAYVQGEQDEEEFDDNLRKLLVATIMQRVRCDDCQKNGYILYGFPQNKHQALCAQQSGLLPRQIYILMPDPGFSSTNSKSTKTNNSNNNPPISGSTMRTTTTTLNSTNPTYISPGSGTTSKGTTTKSGGGAVGTQSPSTKHSDGHSHDMVIIEDHGKVITKVSSHVSLPESDYPIVKEIVDAYDYEICKVIPFEKWNFTKKTDIEAELLANLVSVRPCGTPWIPKLLIVGPPSSGKSLVAEHISTKYGFINVDFIELVRGAANLNDEVAKACKKYLRDMNPLSDAVTKTLIQRRLLRDDCEKKGWILHSFPDTVRQLTVLDILEISPNRILYLACPEDVCWSRWIQKRQQVLERKLEGVVDNVLQWIDEMNFEEFPYGKAVFRRRTDIFLDNFDQISAYFGKKMVYVDATQRSQKVCQFAEMCILRPPIIRYQEPETHVHF